VASEIPCWHRHEKIDMGNFWKSWEKLMRFCCSKNLKPTRVSPSPAVPQVGQNFSAAISTPASSRRLIKRVIGTRNRCAHRLNREARHACVYTSTTKHHRELTSVFIKGYIYYMPALDVLSHNNIISHVLWTRSSIDGNRTLKGECCREVKVCAMNSHQSTL
jgi:hypothetical protein